ERKMGCVNNKNRQKTLLPPAVFMTLVHDCPQARAINRELFGTELPPQSETPMMVKQANMVVVCAHVACGLCRRHAGPGGGVVADYLEDWWFEGVHTWLLFMARGRMRLLGFAGALEIVNECFDYDFVDNSARAPSRIIAD